MHLRRVLIAFALVLASVLAVGPANSAAQDEESITSPCCLAPPVWGSTQLGPTYDPAGYHNWPAVDFRRNIGTNVHAAGAGTIVRQATYVPASPDPESPEPEIVGQPGSYLLLDLNLARGNCNIVAYKHLSGFVYSVGRQVAQHEVIAYTGSTQAPQPHVHMDCWASVAEFDANRTTPNLVARNYKLRWCPGGTLPVHAEWTGQLDPYTDSAHAYNFGACPS